MRFSSPPEPDERHAAARSASPTRGTKRAGADEESLRFRISDLPRGRYWRRGKGVNRPAGGGRESRPGGPTEGFRLGDSDSASERGLWGCVWEEERVWSPTRRDHRTAKKV